MGWGYVIAAAVLELLFTTALRYSEGFTKLWPTVLVFVFGTLTVFLIARATLTLPLGTVYAAWGALGAAGTAIIGIHYFNEPATFWRLFFLTALIASVVGLKLSSDH